MSITIKQLPMTVKFFVQNFDAWIVGSAASPKANISDIADFDVIVPFHEWHKAVSLIPKDATRNSYGGWKYKDGKVEVDVWPGGLLNFMFSDLPKFLWQPRFDLRYANIKK